MATPNHPSVAQTLTTLIGKEGEFSGKLVFQGCVRIEGRVSGEVMSDDILVIAEGAEVDAKISVGTLIVLGGVLRGDVRAARSVEIYKPSRVYATLETPELALEKGATFEGRCTMNTQALGQAT